MMYVAFSHRQFIVQQSYRYLHLNKADALAALRQKHPYLEDIKDLCQKGEVSTRLG